MNALYQVLHLSLHQLIQMEQFDDVYNYNTIQVRRNKFQLGKNKLEYTCRYER